METVSSITGRNLPMSALGQKQTCAAQKGVSAFPPKADMQPAIATGHRLMADSGSANAG
jgi:hypothetical protein